MANEILYSYTGFPTCVEYITLWCLLKQDLNVDDQDCIVKHKRKFSRLLNVCDW